MTTGHVSKSGRSLNGSPHETAHGRIALAAVTRFRSRWVLAVRCHADGQWRVVQKKDIIDEIQRTTATNGGTPLGVAKFQRETGIKVTDWHGKHWSRWGDALTEAGFSPNALQGAYPDEILLDKLPDLSRN